MPTGTADVGTIRVLLADDHPVVRSGLRAALNREPDMSVVGEAGDGIEAEGLATKLVPDVIVMDIYMPRQDGLRSMLNIKQTLPQVKVLFLTVSEVEENLFRAIRFGADGYMLKKSDLAEVVSAVRRVAAGEAILSPLMTGHVMRELQSKQSEPPLSTREREVLDLIAEGLTTVEIARKLSLSQGTVSTYVYRLLDKLHLQNRAEAIAYAVHHPPGAEPF